MGGSDGSPSEHSITAASEAAWAWLLAAGLQDREIVIYGESLGSAVAVKLAARHAPRAVVLEAPMSSVRSIAQQYYPYLPVALLLQDPWLSDEHIASVRSPLLILHGDRDSLIPIESGRALFEAASEPKEFVTVRGASHNDLFLFSPIDQVERVSRATPLVVACFNRDAALSFCVQACCDPNQATSRLPVGGRWSATSRFRSAFSQTRVTPGPASGPSLLCS